MYFDKKEFKNWVTPSNHPNSSIFDVVFVALYLLTVGIIVFPMALLASLKFGRKANDQETE